MKLQITTPKIQLESFDRWFSDGGLKDMAGAPKVFFHGTTRDFDEFMPAHGFGRVKPRSLGGQNSQLWGIDCHAFTCDPRVAEGYAIGKKSRRAADAVLMPVYLRLQNPLDFDAKGAYWSEFHDGVVQLARRYGGKASKQLSTPANRDFAAEVLSRLAEEVPTDGVIIRNVKDEYEDKALASTVVFVFEARNIKSAIGNQGTFNPATYKITE